MYVSLKDLFYGLQNLKSGTLRNLYFKPHNYNQGSHNYFVAIHATIKTHGSESCGRETTKCIPTIKRHMVTTVNH